jgi:hypothetical protein
MPITASDILFKLSVPGASAGDADAQSDPNDSLGGYVSTTEVSGTALNNLFDDVSGQENLDEAVEYRCVFVHNDHASLTLQNAVIYVSAETAGGANAAIGVDTTAASAVDASSAQALIVVDETTAPVGVSFSTPTTRETGLSLGDIAAGEVKAFWIRRTATNSAALNNDGLSVTVSGDTAA